MGTSVIGVDSALELYDLSLLPHSRGLGELLGERHLLGPWRPGLGTAECPRVKDINDLENSSF